MARLGQPGRRIRQTKYPGIVIVQGRNPKKISQSCNYLFSLKREGVPTSFVGKVNGNSFLALKTNPIPIQPMIGRFVSTDSRIHVYCAHCYSDEVFGNTFVLWHAGLGCLRVFRGPEQNDYLFDLRPTAILTPHGRPFGLEEFEQLQATAASAFLVLVKTQGQNLQLQISCGWSLSGEMLVTDVLNCPSPL